MQTLSIYEAAVLVGVPPVAIQQLVAGGIIHSLRKGKAVVGIPRNALEGWARSWAPRLAAFADDGGK
jgi:hypothetical protein